MATIEVKLNHGIKIGDTPQVDAVLREATAGDVIEAGLEAERCIPTPNGYQLVTSPTLLAVHVLARQVVNIGDFEGPLTLNDLKKLSPADLDLLNEKADELEHAALGVAQRGRSDDAGGAAAEADADHHQP